MGNIINLDFSYSISSFTIRGLEIHTVEKEVRDPLGYRIRIPQGQFTNKVKAKDFRKKLMKGEIYEDS